MHPDRRLRGARRVAGLALAALLAGTAAAAAADGGTDERRVLFVGNSLTLANDLPAMVAALSRAAGDEPPLVVETVAAGGVSLEDHWARGDARRAIERGGWEVVVLQQGPSSLPENRSQLRVSAMRFARAIRRAGARPALYMVWPARVRGRDFADVERSYREAADASEALLLPVGSAWRAAWRRDPALPLYGEDDFHPSPLGTYLAALVLYSRIAERSPLGLPARLDLGGGSLVVPDRIASALQLAAADALADAR